MEPASLNLLIFTRYGSIWAINLSENDGNITNLGNIQYYDEIKQCNNGNIGNIGNNWIINYLVPKVNQVIQVI